MSRLVFALTIGIPSDTYEKKEELRIALEKVVGTLHDQLRSSFQISVGLAGTVMVQPMSESDLTVAIAQINGLQSPSEMNGTLH